MDERHHQRLRRVMALFAWSFFDQPDSNDAQFSTIRDIIPHLDAIDGVIVQFASKRSLASFYKLDLAILRQAIFEITINNVPPKVAANEAIEIAKLLGSEETSRFVAGVMGSVLDDRQKIVEN